jgi:ribosomal protein L11 methyltransferase
VAWWQLTVECTGDELEQVEDCLLALGALSLTIGDAQDEPIYEPLPGDTPLWSRSTITGLFDQSQPIEALYDRLVMGLPPHLAPSIKQQELADQVW